MAEFSNNRKLGNRSTESVSVKDFGAVGDGVADDSAAFQAAVDATTDGVIDVPAGTYLFGSAVTLKSYISIVGHGEASEILVNTDIEVFNSSTATTDTAITRCEIKDLFINKTIDGATTKYDIHLHNPYITNIQRVHIKSGHDDTDYSATNVGGIWLEKPSGSTIGCFLNKVDECWIQNNSVYFEGLTDSTIQGGYIWGHVREFAIRLNGGGANAVEKVAGIIPSQHKGGIWIDGTSQNQLRIEGNEFDNNPLLSTGTSINCPQAALAVTVVGNTFWGSDFHGLHLIDPTAWTITGNNFYKGNAADNSYDDIRIESSSFQPTGNTMTANTHIIDESRTNKGYAYKEVNGGGGSPTNNTFAANTIKGSTGYQAVPMLLLGTGNVSAISGDFGIESRIQSGTQLLGNTADASGGEDQCGIIASINESVSAAGTMDLSINESTFSSNAGGFAGTLAVTATRRNAPTQSRRTIYAVVARGSTATFSSLASQDGSGGGSAFTVTMGGDGIIRFTDTSGSGSAIGASMAFYGARSLA